MKTIIAGLLLAGTCSGTESCLPEFSWETVPRYMHVRKATAFTPDEIDYLATFPLITLEKTTGSKTYGSTEAGTLKAAEAIKGVNPKAKILYYRNIIVHYGGYEVDAELKSIPNAFLTNQKGETDLVRKRVKAYDLSNKDVLIWWVKHAKEMCASEYIDGLFVDGNIKVLEEGYLRREVGKEKKAAVIKGYHVTMTYLRRCFDSKEIFLANIIRARFEDAGLEYIKYFDGSYIEGFEHKVGQVTREDYLAKGIDAIQTAARNGKIIAFTIGMGEYGGSEMNIDDTQAAVKDVDSIHERLVYTLSLFLVCAEKYSYFMASDGYGVDNGRSGLWMKPIPEYSYPLGAPKGPAVKDGYIYRRNFEHARVMVDIQKQKAEIIWDKTVQ
jgi:hypothetical protein